MAKAKGPKFTNNWDEEQKKVNLLNLAALLIGAIVVILVIIFALRGHH